SAVKKNGGQSDCARRFTFLQIWPESKLLNFCCEHVQPAPLMLCLPLNRALGGFAGERLSGTPRRTTEKAEIRRDQPALCVRKWMSPRTTNAQAHRFQLTDRRDGNRRSLDKCRLLDRRNETAVRSRRRHRLGRFDDHIRAHRRSPDGG